MSSADFRHRCTTAECPYLGQLTDNLACGCHRKEAEIMRAELTRFVVPRPIAEYHEDMGDVLWWCWEPPKQFERISEYVVSSAHDGRWLGEPPYVGSPNDLGHEVQVKVETTIAAFSNQREGEHSYSLNVGGWPGYHTHFTPIPLPKEPSQ